MKKKNYIFSRRLISYIIDLVILSILVSITLLLFKYKSQTIDTEMANLSELLLNKEININTYINKYSELLYKNDSQKIIVSIINLVYSIILFIIIPIVNNCQTIGQKLTKIKLEKINDKKISILDLTIKSMILYFLGYLIISLITINLLSRISYLIVTLFLGLLTFLLVFISGFMILYSKDQRGIYDIITKIKVRVIK